MATTEHKAKKLKVEPKYTLHLYDHCPYCVRVELVLGWNDIAFDTVVYGYGDMEGPKKLVGKKVLPVLEWKDDNGNKTYMMESGDIIEKILNDDKAKLLPKTTRPDLEEWMERMKPVQRVLSRPRLFLMPVNDWAKPEDISYAKSKYLKQGFDYDEAEIQTDKAIVDMNVLLKEVEPMVKSEQYISGGDGYSWDDVFFLPELRTLTCVQGLSWPKKIWAYVESAHVAAKLKTYTEFAVGAMPAKSAL